MRAKQVDRIELARRYRSVVIALIAACGFYATAIAMGITGIGSIYFGPCADAAGPPTMIVFAVVKLYAISSVVRLSDQLGDPSPIGVLQFLLMLPFLIDVPVLAFDA